MENILSYIAIGICSILALCSIISMFIRTGNKSKNIDLDIEDTDFEEIDEDI